MMVEWFWSDFMGFVLFGIGLAIVWNSNTTSAGAAITAPLVIMTAAFAHKPVLWLGVPIFPGQFFLAFSCVALAAVHARLGEYAAHRVWRIVCVSIILAFLVTSRFLAIPDMPGYDIGEHYTQEIGPKLRLWASIMFLFIFIGGTGQVIWKVTHWEGWKRYATTIAGFPAASLSHSVIAFYGTVDDFWERALNSLFVSTYAGTVSLGILILLMWTCDNSEKNRNARIRKSSRELMYGNGQAQRSDRSVSPSRRK